MLNFSVSFPKQFTPLYHYTLKAQGLEDNHLIPYDPFAHLRMIIALDLIVEDIKEGLDPEFTGNLRLNNLYNLIELLPQIKLNCCLETRKV